MTSIFALHGIWLFVAKLAVLPISGWAIYHYYRLAQAWLAGTGSLDHRLGIVARDILRTLAEYPENWHQLDPFCLAFSTTPISYSHQASLRLWLSDSKRMSLDGAIEHAFTQLETARLKTAVASWSRGRGQARAQQGLNAQPDVSRQDDGLDETVRLIIRSFQEYPERWHQYRVVYARYFAEANTTAVSALGRRMVCVTWKAKVMLTAVSLLLKERPSGRLTRRGLNGPKRCANATMPAWRVPSSIETRLASRKRAFVE